MQHNQRSVFKVTLVVLVFACLTLGLTFPVITKMTTEVAGGGSDLYQTAADVITSKARFEQLGVFGSIRDTLVHQRFDSISLYGYFSALFGFPLGYNIFWLLSFLLSGLGMYFLARTLLKEWSANSPAIPYISFFAGIVYAFTPAHFHWALGFRGATHIEWIPWSILLLHSLLKRPSVARFIGLLVFFVLLFKGESHFAAFLMLFLVPYFWFYRRNVATLLGQRRFRWYALAFVVLCAAVLVFSYSRYLNISLSGNNYLNPGIDQAINYSNDLLGILTPTYSQAIWGDAFTQVRNTFTGNEFSSPSYVGIVVLLLSGFALWRRRNNVGQFWLFMGISFFILSMGPVLHIAGIIEPRIPLPYILIYKFIPFFENIRTVNRLIIFAVLGFSLASSFGLLRIVELKVKSIRWQRLLPIILSGFVIVEYLSIPMTTTKLHHSPFYDMIRNEPGDYQILEIPSATSYDASSLSSYYLRIHKKKLVNDYQFGRQDATNALFIRNTTVPILSELIYRLPRNTELLSHTAIDTSNPDVNTEILNKYNVRYITLSKEFIGDTTDKISLKNFIGIKNFIKNNLRTREVYEDNDLIAYQLFPGDMDTPTLTLSSGWSRPIILEKTAYQWVNGPAKMNISTPSAMDSLSIAFNARTNKKSLLTLKIEHNNTVIGQYLVTPQSQPIEITLPDIAQGNTEVIFTALDGNGDPVSRRIEKPIGLSNIQITDNSVERSTPEDYFGERLSGKVLEIPFRNSTETLNQEGLHVIAPQEILESYRDKIGGTASTKLPILSDLMLSNHYTDKSLQKLPDIITTDYYRAEIASILDELAIENISIRTDILPMVQLDALQKFISTTFPVKNKRVTNSHVLFDVNPPTDQAVPFIQYSGLSPRKIRIESPTLIRKLKVDSFIILANPTTQVQTGELSFSLNTCRNQARIVNILQDGNNVASLVVDSNQYSPKTIPIELRPGENELILELVGPNAKILTNADLQQCPVGVANFSFQQN